MSWKQTWACNVFFLWDGETWEDGGTRDPRLASENHEEKKMKNSYQLLSKLHTVALLSHGQSQGNIAFRLIASSKRGAAPQSFSASVNCTKATTRLNSPPCPNVLQKRELLERILIPIRNKSGRCVHGGTRQRHSFHFSRENVKLK